LKFLTDATPPQQAFSFGSSYKYHPPFFKHKHPFQILFVQFPPFKRHRLEMRTVSVFALPLVALFIMAISRLGQAQDLPLSPAPPPTSHGHFSSPFSLLNLYQLIKFSLFIIY